MVKWMRVVSDVTGTIYDDMDCVFFRNLHQIAFYVHNGAKIIDVFTDSKGMLVFCFLGMQGWKALVGNCFSAPRCKGLPCLERDYRRWRCLTPLGFHQTSTNQETVRGRPSRWRAGAGGGNGVDWEAGGPGSTALLWAWVSLWIRRSLSFPLGGAALGELGTLSSEMPPTPFSPAQRAATSSSIPIFHF